MIGNKLNIQLNFISMKTRHIFLIISMLMIIFESALGFLAFEMIVDKWTQIALISMMLIGIVVAIIMYAMYKNERRNDYEIYKKSLL